MTASAGETTARSSMKSPRCESSSSPIGVSREIGSCAILSTLRTLATGMSMRLAISSDGGLASQFLHQLPRGPDQLVDSFDHVHRDTDGASLISDGASNGLPNPPRGVGRELVTSPVFELVHGLHQADVAFLNQIEKLQAAVGVLFRDRNHQAKVGLNQFALGLLRVHVALDDLALSALEFLERHSGFDFKLLQFSADGTRLAPVFLALLFAAGRIRLFLQVRGSGGRASASCRRFCWPGRSVACARCW